MMINSFVSPLIVGGVAFVLCIVCVFYLSINLKNGKQINYICSLLLKNNYIILGKNNKRKEIIAKKNNKQVAIKIIIGGKNRGLVITNKDTYFMRVYKNPNAPHIDSWKLDDVKTFINQNNNRNRIIIVLNGYARITKYINENELEAVTINNDAFGTKVLSLDDFETYIKGE